MNARIRWEILTGSNFSSDEVVRAARLAAMIERNFLGWDHPFLDVMTDWLLQRQASLPTMGIVVPTAHAGRRLRESMVERAGGILAPQFFTPGVLISSSAKQTANRWQELVAWVDVLETLDPTALEAIFPGPFDRHEGWAVGIAHEFEQLRSSLQENGLTLQLAAARLSQSIEAERWAAMAEIEMQVERLIQQRHGVSRSADLAEGIKLPSGIATWVLAGVTDMAPIVATAFAQHHSSVIACIGAPESEAKNFSALGIPLPSWAERPVAWPSGKLGSVILVAGPKQQAEEALRQIAECKTPSSSVTLGSPDPEAASELTHLLSQRGWPAFLPVPSAVTPGLWRWLRTWSRWLTQPTTDTLAELLALPETRVLIGGKRAQLAAALSKARDRRMVRDVIDLENLLQPSDRPPSPSTIAMVAAAKSLENERHAFQSGDFSAAAENLLVRLAAAGPATAEAANAFLDWLREASSLIDQSKHPAAFWIDLMLRHVSAPIPLPSADRVIDVLGWLEVFHEPGRHLVICGMNEGRVPTRTGEDPWLGQAARNLLGLARDSDRSARDAYLLAAMIHARTGDGRVDLICGKTTFSGDVLLPSRLLLNAETKDLPDRVKHLFAGVTPPEAGLRWERDWQWQPRNEPSRESLPVTTLRSYLACPFRYYLTHVLAMSIPEPERTEWNARDFGNAAHLAFERWGRDPEARESQNPEEITTYLHRQLDTICEEWFGDRLPMAIRLQLASLKQRFVWAGQVQAAQRAAGWQVIEVERGIEIPLEHHLLKAKIDRVDRHIETGALRVIDYKTGKVDNAARQHQTRIIKNTRIAEHLVDTPAIHEQCVKGKISAFYWQDLQLPLYAYALRSADGQLPTPAYFTLSDQQENVGLSEWADFAEESAISAIECAEWISRQIAAGHFWPPAEKVRYDQFQLLEAGRSLNELVDPTQLMGTP